MGKPETPQTVFVGMAIDMSWRLAVVVLVPIVGGFEIDSHVGTTPLLTVIGFLLAIGGIFVVMRQTVRAANVASGKSAPAANVVAPKPSSPKASSERTPEEKHQ